MIKDLRVAMIISDKSRVEEIHHPDIALGISCSI